MSHITHFYHLAALDYIDASHLGHPFNPPAGKNAAAGGDLLDGSTGTGAALVGSYVAALSARRRAHTMGALISGRQPIMNAYVPGGATTLLDATHGAAALSQFQSELNIIRNFIDNTMISDVVTVAQAYGTGGAGLQNYWNFGTGTGNLLAYGDFDVDGAGTQLLKRGLVVGGVASLVNIDQNNIVEYIGYSHYQDYANPILPVPGSAKHPWSGETRPQFEKANSLGTSYSWQKAPRYMYSGSPLVCEVGPLARMACTALNDLSLGSPSQGGASQTVPDSNLGLGNYTAAQLIDYATNAVLGVVLPASWSSLLSVLGRHAARVLEAKFIADAMSVWITQVAPGAQAYTYMKIPKGIKSGVGLVEAPRGALGHWIKIEKKRILSYQCVVPSTWNISPRDDTGQLGAAEYTLANSGSLGANLEDIVINILRILHTWDFCSACSIHLLNADKKKLATIHMETDGSVKVIPAE
jgi:hydrogenase large subunit